MIEDDVNDLISILGRDVDKTFAEAAGNSIRRILGRISEESSSIVCGLIIDFELEYAMEMLDCSYNFARAYNLTDKINGGKEEEIE